MLPMAIDSRGTLVENRIIEHLIPDCPLLGASLSLIYTLSRMITGILVVRQGTVVSFCMLLAHCPTLYDFNHAGLWVVSKAERHLLSLPEESI